MLVLLAGCGPGVGPADTGVPQITEDQLTEAYFLEEFPLRWVAMCEAAGGTSWADSQTPGGAGFPGGTYPAEGCYDFAEFDSCTDQFEARERARFLPAECGYDWLEAQRCMDGSDMIDDSDHEWRCLDNGRGFFSDGCDSVCF